MLLLFSLAGEIGIPTELVISFNHPKQIFKNFIEDFFGKAIKAGAISVVKPTQKPWGQLVSYVRDNNGCLVEICSLVEGA